MRKIIAYLATSADGYIARADGDVGWLDRPQPAGNYGMGTFFASIDTILWGRKTYDFARENGGIGAFGKKVKNYLFSRNPSIQPEYSMELVTEPISTFAKKLRSAPGKNIWMMGGGELITSFLDEGEIDEFSIHVIPIFIGDGIPLIARRPRTVKLELLSTKQFPDGVVHLNFRTANLRPLGGGAS